MNLHYRRGPSGPAKKFDQKDEQRYRKEANRDAPKAKPVGKEPKR